jgi:hypothetical protein
MYGERGRHVQGQLLQGELRQDQVLPNFLSIATLRPFIYVLPARRKKSSVLVQLLNFSVRYKKLGSLGTER